MDPDDPVGTDRLLILERGLSQWVFAVEKWFYFLFCFGVRMGFSVKSAT